ncbi:uncharacterized protein G2W53_033917 [Senna tora]|uniref:DUF4283 domain-containing protein n=1 Tax=Senna tora TaxID=362788 RepID=A0A834T292_9FABA|nr:uncharacterized protein G2W53_033917 [Senna tora]
MKSMISKTWNLQEGLGIIEVASNTFMFKLDKEEDCVKILRGIPWQILGHLLIHGIPLEGFCHKNAMKLRAMLVKFTEVEDFFGENKILKSFIRVKMLVDVRRVLILGIWVPRPNLPKIWFLMKYERLQHFYYNCGTLEHYQKDEVHSKPRYEVKEQNLRDNKKVDEYKICLVEKEEVQEGMIIEKPICSNQDESMKRADNFIRSYSNSGRMILKKDRGKGKAVQAVSLNNSYIVGFPSDGEEDLNKALVIKSLADRLRLWDSIISLNHGDASPWIAMEDFNYLASNAEKKGGLTRSARRLWNFQSLLFDCCLMDMSFKGAKFTWINKQIGDDHIKERLDITVCNHRFQVTRTWREMASLGMNEIEGFLIRLNRCIRELVTWSKSTIPNSRDLVETLFKELRICMQDIFIEQKVAQMNSLLGRIEEAWDKEENFWHQRLRVNWLKARDKNTTFFHAITVKRRQRNKILSLKVDDDIWFDNEDDITDKFNDFYKKLFNTLGSREMVEVLSFVSWGVTDEKPKSHFLPKLVLENQRAFVSGRNIQNNFIVAHKARHYLKMKNFGGKIEMALKFDMNKAYNRLEWDFISIFLLKLGKIVGRVHPKRAYENGELEGIKVARGCPTLTHCFFVDDAIFFLRVKGDGYIKLKEIFEAYCLALGQATNLYKSCVFFSKNTPSGMVNETCNLLGILNIDSLGKYLGLSVIWRRSRSEALSFIRDKVIKKVQGWKQNLLSRAGREVLIKSMANTIPL